MSGLIPCQQLLQNLHTMCYPQQHLHPSQFLKVSQIFYSFPPNLFDLASWNRLSVEIIQAQPLDFDDGYYTVRLFVNGDWTSRVSFGDIASKDIPIANGNNAAFDICGARSSSTQNLINTGSFDIMNLFMSPRAQVFHNNSAGNAIPFPPIFSLFFNFFRFNLSKSSIFRLKPSCLCTVLPWLQNDRQSQMCRFCSQ